MLLITNLKVSAVFFPACVHNLTQMYMSAHMKLHAPIHMNMLRCARITMTLSFISHAIVHVSRSSGHLPALAVVQLFNQFIWH